MIFLIFLLFQLTIGSVIKNYEKKMDKYFSKLHLESVKSIIREEMNKATEKEIYLNSEKKF